MSEKGLASSGDSFVGLTEMQTVDLLNKLSDENTRLHKKVDEQQATISALHEENTSFKESQDGKRRAILWWEYYKEKWANAEKELRKLKEENEQLKSERRNNAKEFSALFKQNFGLKRENNQLRKELYECEKDYLIETSDEVDRALYVDDELKELAKKYGVEDD